MKRLSEMPGPIGVFDSGYGGLTILNEIQRVMPDYDYIYLGIMHELLMVLARLTLCIVSRFKQ